MGKTLIFETAGIPGSGKSRFIKELKQKLSENKIESEILSDKLKGLTSSAFTYYSVILYAVFRILSSASLTYLMYTLFKENKIVNKTLTFKSSLIRLALEQHYKKTADTVLLIDEGSYQLGASLFSGVDTISKNEAIAKYYNYIIKPDIMAVFNISTNESVHRMKTRGNTTKRLKGMSDEDVISFVNNQKYVIDLAKDQVRAETVFYDLKNETEEDMYRNIQIISEIIMEKLEG